MIFFLDACVVIYWVEAKPPFHDKLMAQLGRLKARHPDARFAVSRLSLLECRIKPLQDFFSAFDLEIVELNPSVIEIGTQLRAHHKLRTPDALQAACALSLEEEVLFLSSDATFKKLPKLKFETV